MQSALYPLKFLPLFKNVIWGGNKLQGYGFNYAPLPNCGELWALSSVEGRESVIANGFLAENTLNEAIEIYMGDLVGDKVYNRFGTEFPPTRERGSSAVSAATRARRNTAPPWRQATSRTCSTARSPRPATSTSSLPAVSMPWARA